MSIDAKHSYRFGFLKSDKWKAVRLEALVREKGKCQICQAESIYNDAHHVWYPENIYDTTEMHLVILCRSCHNFIHALLPECKTSDEQAGLETWNKFRNAILAWRQEKQWLFSMERAVELPPITRAGELRDAYDLLKQKYREQAGLLERNEKLLTVERHPPIQIIVPIVPDPPTDVSEQPDVKPVKAKELRDAYDALKKRCRALESLLAEYASKLGVVPPTPLEVPPVESMEYQLEKVLGTIKRWAKFYKEYS